MRKFLVMAALAAAPAWCAAAPASAESVDLLLEVTRTRALLDQAYLSVEQTIRQRMEQAAAGRSLSEEQRRLLDTASARLADLMRSELSWDKLKPIYAAVYQETFDQDEIDGLIAFYRTPVGRSFVEKMPAVMQRSMAVMQVQMREMLPKIRQAMEEVLREAKLPPKT